VVVASETCPLPPVAATAAVLQRRPGPFGGTLSPAVQRACSVDEEPALPPQEVARCGGSAAVAGCWGGPATSVLQHFADAVSDERGEADRLRIVSQDERGDPLDGGEFVSQLRVGLAAECSRGVPGGSG
jgi:hypothetical protein